MEKCIKVVSLEQKKRRLQIICRYASPSKEKPINGKEIVTK